MTVTKQTKLLTKSQLVEELTHPSMSHSIKISSLLANLKAYRLACRMWVSVAEAYSKCSSRKVSWLQLKNTQAMKTWAASWQNQQSDKVRQAKTQISVGLGLAHMSFCWFLSWCGSLVFGGMQPIDTNQPTQFQKLPVFGFMCESRHEKPCFMLYA